MSTIKSSNEHLTFNADGTAKEIRFQADGTQKASISSAGAFTATTIDATVLTGNLPAISGANLTGITGTTTRIHAFSKNAAGKLIWTHTEGTLSLTNSSGVNNYLDWHIGSSDQVYTVNSDGKLICTYT